MNFSSSFCLSPLSLVQAVASACGFRSPYSCGAAEEFHLFPLIRLQTIFYLVNQNIRPFSDEELAKGTMMPRNHRLCGLLGKD